MKLGVCIGLALGIVAACGEGDDARPGPAGHAGGGSTSTGGTSASGGRAGNPGSAGASQAGDAEAGSEAAGATSAGAPGAGGAGASGSVDAGRGGGNAGGAAPKFPCSTDGATTLPAFTGVCATTVEFAGASPVAVDAGNAARLIALSPDELTIVWSALGSSKILYYFAERASTEDGFGVPVPLVTDGSVVGMSPDGLRVVTLSQDGRSYSELVRDAAGSEFGAESEGAFTLLNAAAGAQDLTYSDCVIAADDRTLVYTAEEAGGSPYPVLISVRMDDEPWPVGESVSACELEAHGSLLRHPTGISADALTLFFFDPDRNFARGAWRATTDSPFTWFRDFPGLGQAAPNAGCDKLYYSGAVGQTPLLIAGQH